VTVALQWPHICLLDDGMGMLAPRGLQPPRPAMIVALWSPCM
jgi:hypothetical protein